VTCSPSNGRRAKGLRGARSSSRQARRCAILQQTGAAVRDPPADRRGGARSPRRQARRQPIRQQPGSSASFSLRPHGAVSSSDSLRYAQRSAMSAPIEGPPTRPRRRRHTSRGCAACLPVPHGPRRGHVTWRVSAKQHSRRCDLAWPRPQRAAPPPPARRVLRCQCPKPSGSGRLSSMRPKPGLTYFRAYTNIRAPISVTPGGSQRV
jgi:hypothetical protein